MAYKAGANYYGQLMVSSIATGFPASADLLPTAQVVRNGADVDSSWLTVSSTVTGVYVVGGVIPSTYARNDVLQVRAEWLVGGVRRAEIISDFQLGPLFETAYAAKVRAQVLLDTVDWYPGCGDAFEHAAGAATGPIELRAAIILRGDAHGIVVEGANMTGAPDITVTAVEVGGGSDGTAVTDLRGGYQTDEPHVRGNNDARVTAQLGDVFPTVVVPMYSRKRQRAVLKGVVGTNYACIEADGPRQWLHVSLDTTAAIVRTYYLPSLTLAFQSTPYAGIDGFTKMRVDTRRASLLLLGKSGGGPFDFKLLDSLDGGMTAVEILTVTADSMVIERDSERGMVVVLYETAGAVLRRRSLDGGATWGSPTSPTLDGGAMVVDPLIDMTADSRRANMMLVGTVGGTNVVMESLDMGETWATRLT